MVLLEMHALDVLAVLAFLEMGEALQLLIQSIMSFV